MEADQDATDSSDLEIEDEIDISLLPERKRHSKKRFGGWNSSLKPRKMCGRNTAIYCSVTALLLLFVVLIAAFARASSSYDTVNKKSEERSPYYFRDTKDKWQPEQEARDQAIHDHSLRLPRNLLPIEYLVYLHPNLTTFKFIGKVDILLFCEEDTERIVLHIGNEMTVKKVEVAEILEENQARKLNVEDISRNQEVEMLTITPNETLIAGKYYFLLIEFDSTLSRGLSGFYLSSYVTKSGEKRYLATTHFEPTDARKAFPCFDEPDLKANFTIVIVREKHHVALANMPKERTDKCGSNDSVCIDHFEQSVKMSTYLVAFVVCDYHNVSKITKRGIKVAVWAPPEQIDQGNFALGVAVEVLSYYEEKFNVPYPLPKQDLIAIPDFAAGAMENWGLITYRLTSLLYDENESSDSNKQWVAVVVAHELAHQWFGNLVTMKWWNDLWLNEGFASFMENVGVNHVHPEWKMMDQFLLDKFQLALNLDQLSSSHPIMAEVKDPAQINSLFDTISYDKGAAVIRMLEEVLGSDVFFKGLQRYLQKYKFRNAETDDLWECIALAAKDAGEEIDVKEMMDTWTGQMGFPVIRILRSSSDPRIVTATQEHFLIYPGENPESSSKYSWVVPLTFISQNNENKETFIMKKDDREVAFELPHGTEMYEWIKVNAQQSGYYRVNYDINNWEKLLHQLQTDHMKLSAADRAGLLDDSSKLARAGMLDNRIALDLTLYLRNEKDYVPWMSALGNMAYIATQFSTYDSVKKGSEPAYSVYKRYVFGLLKSLAKELGWEEKKDDSHLKRYLRASILRLAAEYDVDEETDVAAVARQWFLRWLKDDEEIPPNLRNTVYSIGMKDADREIWDTVFEKFHHEIVPSEKRKLLYALTKVEDLNILKELLDFSLDDSKIRSQDTVAVINSIAQNPSGRIEAWEFVKKHYDELFKRYGEGSFDFSRLIKSTTSHFNTEGMYNDVVDFFSEKDAGSGKLAVKQSKESIQANINWIRENMSEVFLWLKKQTSHHADDSSIQQRNMGKEDEYERMLGQGRP